MSSGNFGQEEPSRFPAAFVVGVVVVSAIVAISLFVTRSSHPARPGQVPQLPFASEAQNYAGNIHFQSLALSESSNMLNEKFTYLDGVISNDGSRTIQAMEIRVEFHDPFNQMILRETHRVIADQPLGPGKQLNFEITFEHVPAEWNQQYPTIRVTGLVLR
ncbi:MAG: DUF2393 family protein [Acidobacteriota bacterium]|nr:DUF2393 family protein [Acidobacteriota bacterium]